MAQPYKGRNLKPYWIRSRLCWDAEISHKEYHQMLTLHSFKQIIKSRVRKIINFSEWCIDISEYCICSFVHAFLAVLKTCKRVNKKCQKYLLWCTWLTLLLAACYNYCLQRLLLYGENLFKQISLLILGKELKCQNKILRITLDISILAIKNVNLDWIFFSFD